MKRARSMGILTAGLAVLFCVLTAGPGTAYGASAIDTGKTDCKITFTLDADVLEKAGGLAGLETAAPDYKQYYGELAKYLGGDSSEEGAVSAENAIQVRLYQIAEVNAGGTYVLLPEYEGLEELKGVESADSNTTAGQWLEWAKAAAERAVGTIQEDGAILPPSAGALTADQTARISLVDGKAVGEADGLQTGLYLVWVEPVDTDFYRYSFVPYLVSLPSQYYDPEDGDSSDEWIYGDQAEKPVYVGLKPEREERYGNLVIEKKLSSYNETLQGASFVFEVKAVKDGALVYSDVVALTFDGCGTKQVEIPQIPAGAEVTVTEAYSGAGYASVDGVLTRSTVITAGSDSTKVIFENEYDGKLNGGGVSVVNHFTYEKDENGVETLNWEKQYGEGSGEREDNAATNR